MPTSANTNPAESAPADASSLSLVAQQTTNAVVITDSHGAIEWVNAGFTRLTGYSLDEVRGRTPGSVLQGPDTDRATVERLRVAIRAGQGISEEILNYTKAGAPYWISMQISPIFDERGGLARLIAIQTDISERRAAAEALQRSEAYLRAVIGSVPVILFALDRDGVFTLSEGRGLDTMGLAPGEVVGRSAFELYAFRPQIVADLRRALAGEEFSVVSDMDALVFDTRYSALRDERGAVAGTIGVAIDVSAHLRANAALQATSTRLTALIANLQAAVIVEDENRLLTVANQAFCQMFAIPAPPEALIGSDCAESARASAHLFADPDQALARIGRILERRRPISAELVPMADGRMLERDYVPILVGQDHHGHLWLYRDITSRIRDTAELLRAKEAAEAATRAKSAFLATMSHEIRTPLNAMIGMTSLILDTELTDDQRQSAETVRSSGDMLLSLINNILDFSKIESDHMGLEQQPFSMRSCLDEVVELLAPSAAEKGLRLSGELSGQVPDQIMGDITRVRQVLVNLVANAVKFTPSGEVHILATARPDEDDPAALQMMLSVSDTGIGIAPGRVDRLFQPFSQIDASTTRRFGGTGLGLAISRRLSELMGGSIAVRSREGLGSTFRFTFRAAPAPAAAVVKAARRPAQRQGDAAAAHYPLRVLVAEDNSVNQHVVLRMLDRLGYRADLAANGLEVLDALRRQEYDVVLMDVQMPELDGLDATRQLRAMLPPERQPYVIAVTANALSGDREACLAAGMDDYISKPMQRADLEAALAQAGAIRAGDLAVRAAEPPPRSIDLEALALLRESLGDDGEFSRLLRLFYQQADEDIAAMRALADAGESPLTIGRLAHRLKGSGASLGAVQLSQLCQRLDTYTRQGGVADAPRLLAAIEGEYARVCAELARWSGEQPAAPG